LSSTSFLSRISILTRDIDIANLSVCLSVCPSVRYVPVPDENGLTYRHIFSPYGSPIILVLSASNIFTKFRRRRPRRGAKYRWGIKISRLLTNKSLYLANDTRYRHSSYERRIVCDLSNGAKSNDLEQTLTPISRSRYYSTSNNSQTVQDIAIVTMLD